MSIEKTYLVYEEYQVQTTTYVIENTTAKPLSILIEAPIRAGFDLFDTAPVAVETATDRRWRVSISARSRSEFTRKERQRTQRYEELRELDYQRLQQFLDNHWLDRATVERLSALLDKLAVIQRSQAELNDIDNKREALYKQQEQLRANLSALNPTGQEAALRNRVLSQLEGTQDRLEAMDRRVTELNQQIADAEQQIDQIIAGLG